MFRQLCLSSSTWITHGLFPASWLTSKELKAMGTMSAMITFDMPPVKVVFEEPYHECSLAGRLR